MADERGIAWKRLMLIAEIDDHNAIVTQLARRLTDAIGRLGPEEIHRLLARARELEADRRRTNYNLRAAERETSNGAAIEQVFHEILTVREHINDRVRALTQMLEGLLKESGQGP